MPSDLDLYRDFPENITWLMDPRKDYVPFWVNGRCNELKECASIYGCQGFEIDYAGVIWGRDFVFRDGRWELGESCTDNVGRPSLSQIFKKAKSDQQAAQQALQLLRNRYRIFLTRGIKGTYILCEDKSAEMFLRHAIPLTHLV